MDEINPNQTNFSGMFEGTNIKNDIIFPTNATNVSNCFKGCTGMTHIHSNWETEYTAMENTTDCYAGCTGITHCDGVDLGVNDYTAGLDEVPTDWGGYGFSKNKTLIIELTIPSDNYTITLGQCYTSTPNPYKGVWMTSFGDGTYNRILAVGDYGKISHTYEKAGTYILKTHRLLYGIDNATRKTFTKIINIHKYLDVWGITEHFSNCTNLIEVDLSNLAGISFNANSLFENCNKLTKVIAPNFKPSNCWDIFRGCSSLTEIIGIETWNMSGCANCNYMFAGVGITDFSFLDSMDFSKVQYAEYMFQSTKITSLPIDLKPNFTSILGMFTSCTQLTDVSRWNVEKDVSQYDFSRVFNVATSITEMVFNNWTGNFNAGQYMIAGIRGLVTFDVRNCNEGSIDLFWDCPNTITNIYPPKTLKADMTSFSNCNKLTVDSLVRIINALYDFASEGNTNTHTLQIGNTNLAKLTDEQIAIATNKGWTVS